MADENKEMIAYEDAIQLVRGAIEDRATWFHLLTKQMTEAGVDAEAIARKAIREFGCLKSDKMVATDDMEYFIKQFAHKLVFNVFGMEIVEVTQDKAIVQFHKCPLVDAWKRLGCSPERVDYLCDWAVEGDYGVMKNFPSFEFTPEQRLATGAACCRMVFTRKA